MNNPFLDTVLYTTVALHPSQLNNNIYSNLKQNLIKMLEKKCYKNYGYISKIYEILERDNGNIIPEDNDSCAVFKIKFSCRLCHPLENTQIICKVNLPTDIFISLSRSPIHLIVTNDNDRINGNVFFKDPFEKKIKIKKTGEVLETGTFVKATIISKEFTDKDRRIIAMGRLDDIATDEEVEKFYGDEYLQDKQLVEFGDYVKMKPEKPVDISMEKNTKIKTNSEKTGREKTSSERKKKISSDSDSSLDMSSTEEVKTGGKKVMQKKRTSKMK